MNKFLLGTVISVFLLLSTEVVFADDEEDPAELDPITVTGPDAPRLPIMDGGGNAGVGAGSGGQGEGGGGGQPIGEDEEGEGCSETPAHIRLAIASSKFTAMISACIGAQGLGACLSAYGPGKYWTYTWPDGSSSTFQILAPLSSVPLVELSCDE